MLNFVQPGNTVTLPAPYAVSAGDGLKAGAIFGVAAGDAAVNDPVETDLVGVFDLAKATGEAWSIGDKVYWNDGARKCTTTASGNLLVGAALAAAALDATAGRVRLNGTV